MSGGSGLNFSRVHRAHSYAAGRWRTMVPRFDVDLAHDRNPRRGGLFGDRKAPRPFLELDLDEQALVVARTAWRELTLLSRDR